MPGGGMNNAVIQHDKEQADKMATYREVDYSVHWDVSEQWYSASSTSDSYLATNESLRDYADIVAERMGKDNLDEIDKDHIAGMIYAILMKDDVDDKIFERHLDARPGKQKMFNDEDFEL